MNPFEFLIDALAGWLDSTVELIYITLVDGLTTTFERMLTTPLWHTALIVTALLLLAVVTESALRWIDKRLRSKLARDRTEVRGG